MRPHNLHRLTIKHMQALVALDREASISKASDMLGISQPALSSRLQEVERLSRTPCFHRVGNRLSFTQAGLILLNAARMVLDELKRAEGYLEQQDAAPVQVIRLETRGYLLEDWLSPLLARFMAETPGTVVETSCSDDSLPYENLLDGKVDVSIVMGDVTRSGVDRHFLRTDELVGVVAPGHPLAGRSHLDAGDFRGETLLVFSATLERGQEVDRLFAPAGVLPQRVLAAGTAQFVCAMVASGAGLGILGKWAAQRAVESYGLRTVRLTPAGLTSNWYAACVRHGATDTAISSLLQLLKQSTA
jgi:LysR family transcriptional regulator for metE and metH